MLQHRWHRLVSRLSGNNGLPWGAVFHLLESLAITFSILVGLSLFIFGLKIESWVHEWANFLTHYSVAPSEARTPVNAVLAAIYLIAFSIVWLARRKKGQ